MQYFGYYEQEPLGEICPQNMVDGVIRIADLSECGQESRDDTI